MILVYVEGCGTSLVPFYSVLNDIKDKLSLIIRDLRSVDYGLSGRKKAKLTVDDAVEFVNLCSTEKIVDGKKRVQTIWQSKRPRSHH